MYEKHLRASIGLFMFWGAVFETFWEAAGYGIIDYVRGRKPIYTPEQGAFMIFILLGLTALLCTSAELASIVSRKLVVIRDWAFFVSGPVGLLAIMAYTGWVTFVSPGLSVQPVVFFQTIEVRPIYAALVFQLVGVLVTLYRFRRA